MTARRLVEKLHPSGTISELAAGANHVFRVLGGDGSTSIVKVYPVASREKRERHALEALEGVEGIPAIHGHGLEGSLAWLQMSDGGSWNLASLPKNLRTVHSAGILLRLVHDAPAKITNLAARLDGAYVANHFRSTIERLGRFRRRFGIDQAVLDRALEIEPPPASDPVTAHTRTLPSKFVVDGSGRVTLVDWEWGTLGPPEWDLSLAVWRLSSTQGEDAATTFSEAYGSRMEESGYRSWVAYHSAVMMLEAAEVRQGRLGDLGYLVDDLAGAVTGGTRS